MSWKERISGIKEFFTKNKDYNKNEKVNNSYDRQQQIAINLNNDIQRRQKNSLNISEQVLQKYTKDHHEDMQKKILQDYDKKVQDMMYKQSLNLEENQQEQQEVDEAVRDMNLDKSQEEKVKKAYDKEKEEDKNKNQDEQNKDKKEALKQKVTEVAYNELYDEYNKKVLNIKDVQARNKSLTLDEKDIIEILAMEKCLEKISKDYNVKFQKQVKDIKGMEEKENTFQKKFNQTQSAIESNTKDRVYRNNDKFIERCKKYEIYIRALQDPTKTPQELEEFKKDYELANYALIQEVPSMNEYLKELDEQGISEKLAREENLESSAINGKFGVDGKNEQITKSTMADIIHCIKDAQQNRELIKSEDSQIAQRNAMDKGEHAVVKDISDLQRDDAKFSENINQVDPKRATVKETRDEVERNASEQDNSFMAGLRQQSVSLDNVSSEQLEDIAKDNNNDARDKVQAYAEKQSREQEQQREIQIKKNKRPNG